MYNISIKALYSTIEGRKDVNSGEGNRFFSH